MPWQKYSPVTKWWDEIEAAMHTVIYDVPSVQTTLIVQVALKLLIDVGDYGLKAGKQMETWTVLTAKRPVL